MALTAAQLAAALGIVIVDRNGASLPAAVAEAERLLSIGQAVTTAELAGGTAPDAIADESVIRVAGHVRGRGVTHYGAVESHSVGSLKVTLTPAAVNAARVSGARALLAPWKNRTV